MTLQQIFNEPYLTSRAEQVIRDSIAAYESPTEKSLFAHDMLETVYDEVHKPIKFIDELYMENII